MEEGREKTIQDEVAASINTILPELGQQVAKNVAKKLLDLGMTSMGHLRLVKERDLEGLMVTFQARLLIEAWTKEKGAQPPPKQNLPLQDLQEQDQWNFSINWSEVYSINSKIKNKLETGKKLNRREKVELVKRLVKQVREKVPHATRRIFISVTKQLKRKYPLTFSSELAQGKINKKSLSKRMMDKYDNDKRPKRRTVTEVEAPAIKAAYGCVKWRLAHLPTGETEETQNEKRECIADHFEQIRPEAWNWELVYETMDDTYGTLRKEINKQAEEIERLKKLQKKKKKTEEDDVEQSVDDPETLTTTEQLRNSWPFLFQPAVMLHHFEKLTGTDLTNKFEAFLRDDVEKILEFLFETTKKKNSIKKKWRNAKEQPGNSDNANVAALLLLLLKRFKEDSDNLWQIVDSFVREDEIAQVCTVPKPPCLIIAGGDDLFSTGTIYFTMDGTVLSTAGNLLLGVKLMFASYFVFNLEYAAAAQVTLEFIQRCVADIDPPKGNKRPKGKGHSSDRRIHPMLQSFNDKYDEFFAEKDETDDSDSEN